jgi:hypothetical protein
VFAVKVVRANAEFDLLGALGDARMMCEEIDKDEQGRGKPELIFVSAPDKKNSEDFFAWKTIAAGHPKAMDDPEMGS